MKTCKNCNKPFKEDDLTLGFLKQENIPPSDFCPSCRLKRRLAYMNLTTLYKRKCDMCGAEIFSMYDKNAPFPVFCPKCWWSDAWDALEYGIDYDPNSNIFLQFKQLSNKVPHISLQIDWQYTENSEYVNGTGPVKNSYLAFNASDIDTVFYVRSVSSSSNCINCANSSNIENSYHIYNSTNIYSSSFIESSYNCVDVHYSDNLRNCQNCFLCSHLENKKYYIFNKEYTKEEYEKIISILKDGSYKKHKKIMEYYEKFKKRFPQRSIDSLQSDNVTGNFIFNSKNVYNSFEVIDAENVSNSQFIELGPIFNAFDYTFYGENANNVYEVLNSGTNISNVFFTMHSTTNLINIEYSEYIYNSSNIFFSSGVKNKKYVILNKEYSEDEYLALKKRIISDMYNNPYIDTRKVKYVYGDFFPQELSPFYYTETLGQEYEPLSESEALKLGFRFKNIHKDEPNYDIDANDLPDKISEKDSNIIGKTIKCLNADKNINGCRKAFRITAKEFEFLYNEKIPLPRLCVYCRYKELTKYKPKMQLKEKQCDCVGVNSKSKKYHNKFTHKHQNKQCTNVFKTSKEDGDIYCTDCYDAEFW